MKQQLRDGRLVMVEKATQDFQTSADRLVTAHPNSILIYPLVLEDKTRLVWASKGGVLSKTAVCPLGEKALYAKVAQFRSLLGQQGNVAPLKAVGQELYDCLVKPLEKELTTNGIQHLIFVPDRATNYIPMAALHDGKGYLIERYAVSTVLAAGLTDTSDILPKQSQQIPVLGLGLSEARGTFSALPNVEAELDAILKVGASDPIGLFPGLQFLNQAFDRTALENNLRGHRILHIATHGAFKPSNPRDSYFLLGTGKPYAIPDIQTLRELKDVHLVVLSACETAVGGPDSLGLEVTGISSFFLGDRDRAKAVMASLWLVNDASTALMMQQFYHHLARGKTKAEALRQTQLSLLQGKLTAKDAPLRSDVDVSVEGRSASDSSPGSFSHPYYWAPFILIGNGL
jgi:CHAT domain-containing protein